MRLERGEVVEDPDGCEFGDRTGRGQEQLQNMDSLGCLRIGDIPHVAHDFGSLKVHHFMFMPQPSVKHLHHWFPETLVLLSQLRRQSN